MMMLSASFIKPKKNVSLARTVSHTSSPLLPPLPPAAANPTVAILVSIAGPDASINVLLDWLELLFGKTYHTAGFTQAIREAYSTYKVQRVTPTDSGSPSARKNVTDGALPLLPDGVVGPLVEFVEAVDGKVTKRSANEWLVKIFGPHFALSGSPKKIDAAVNARKMRAQAQQAPAVPAAASSPQSPIEPLPSTRGLSGDVAQSPHVDNSKIDGHSMDHGAVSGAASSTGKVEPVKEGRADTSTMGRDAQVDGGEEGAKAMMSEAGTERPRKRKGVEFDQVGKQISLDIVQPPPTKCLVPIAPTGQPSRLEVSEVKITPSGCSKAKRPRGRPRNLPAALNTPAALQDLPIVQLIQFNTGNMKSQGAIARETAAQERARINGLYRKRETFIMKGMPVPKELKNLPELPLKNAKDHEEAKVSERVGAAVGAVQGISEVGGNREGAAAEKITPASDSPTNGVVASTAQPQKTTSSEHTKTRSGKWSDAETVMFYDALSMCGMDFSMIAQLIPSRDHKQVKSKFKKEEKDHPIHVKEALDRRTKLNAALFAARRGTTAFNIEAGAIATPNLDLAREYAPNK